MTKPDTNQTSSRKDLVVGGYIFLLVVLCPLLFLGVSLGGRDNGSREQVDATGDGLPAIQREEGDSASATQSETTQRSSESRPREWFSRLIASRDNRVPKDLAERMSLGERLLIGVDASPEKSAASQAFVDGDFTTARAQFQQSLQAKSNDPEGLIYFNNTTAATHHTSPILIGVSVPIGQNLDVAKEILRGVAHAQLAVNSRGGIKGRLVQIVLANDDNDPEISQAIAAEFVDNDDILAVIGHNASKATLAASQIYNNGQLVAISPTSTATEISGSGDYIFRTAPSTRVTASTLARHAVQVEEYRDIAICADSSDQASQSFQDEFVWSVLDFGGQVVEIPCDFSASDFNPAVATDRAVDEGADAMLLAPSLYSINRAINIARTNRGRLPLLGNQTLYTYSSLQHGHVHMQDMILAVAWHPDEVIAPEYLAQAKELWGGPGNWRTAAAYDATIAALQGLQQGNSTRDDLLRSLVSSNFRLDGATGAVEFLTTGDRSMLGVLVEVKPGDKSGTGFDFLPLERDAAVFTSR